MRETVVAKRRLYSSVKRRARTKYKLEQKSRLHNAAQTNSQEFWREIRKIKGNSKIKSTLTPQQFFEHFKNLYSTENIFANDDTEQILQDDSFIFRNVEQLDCSFSVQEVEKAIGCLKRGKSSGEDALIPEIFLETKSFMSPILCRLFNYMFENSIYPESWTRGIIVPVPKKGNLNDVNNYRGITLTSVFSKIFSLILDSRLRKWAEDNEKLSDNQFGFRSKRSTVDCIFVLTSIINKVLFCDKKKLYCAFVDFRKAFDLVYRNGIWVKLINQGVSSKMVNMLRAIYESVKSCVRVNGRLSDYFDSYMGVKQGEPLSPLLFIFFIDDMAKALKDDTQDYITLNELQIFLLLFADDTVLFSETPKGLQLLLDKLYAYCSKWGIAVNVDKTVAMVFKQGNVIETQNFYYNGELLKQVTKFTYLGVTLAANGKFYQAQKSLSEQATKTLFSLNSLFEKVHLDISEKLKLFDSMIMPILMYGAEAWGFHGAPDAERVYTKFLKRMLCVRPQTTNAAVYGELGRVPLHILRKERLLKYWFKIKNSRDTLLHKAFSNMKDSRQNAVGWALEMKHLLNSLGFNYLWDNENVSNMQIKRVIETLYDQYLQRFYAKLRDSDKLITYSKIKGNFAFEKYLTCVNNTKHRIALTRLRCSAHRLHIEEGRFRNRNTNRNDRLCNKCNMQAIENEYHFLMTCPFYRDIRREILPRYYNVWPSQQKFISLMTTTQQSILRKLSKYVYMAFELRNNNS